MDEEEGEGSEDDEGGEYDENDDSGRSDNDELENSQSHGNFSQPNGRVSEPSDEQDALQMAIK